MEIWGYLGVWGVPPPSAVCSEGLGVGGLLGFVGLSPRSKRLPGGLVVVVAARRDPVPFPCSDGVVFGAREGFSCPSVSPVTKRGQRCPLGGVPWGSPCPKAGSFGGRAPCWCFSPTPHPCVRGVGTQPCSQPPCFGPHAPQCGCCGSFPNLRTGHAYVAFFLSLFSPFCF